MPVQLRTNEWNLQQTQQATAEDHWLQTWMVMIKSDSLWLLKKYRKAEWNAQHDKANSLPITQHNIWNKNTYVQDYFRNNVLPNNNSFTCNHLHSSTVKIMPNSPIKHTCKQLMQPHLWSSGYTSVSNDHKGHHSSCTHTHPQLAGLGKSNWL